MTPQLYLVMSLGVHRELVPGTHPYSTPIENTKVCNANICPMK